MAVGRGVIGEAAVRIRPDTANFAKETKSGIGSSMLKLGGALGAGFAAFKLFDFAKDSVIGFNSTLEQSRAAFKNLLGSGKDANKMLSDLQNFAKTTPFAFEQLIPVSQQLVGALGKGVDVTGTLTQLGDAISATGGSAAKLDQLTLAYTQLATSGTAHLGDLMQINNAVPGALARMAEASGQSVGEFRESVSKSMVSSGEAVKLFKKVTTDPKFGIAGGMEAQSKTFAGAMSNIGDAAQQMLAQAGKPIFEFVSNAAHDFADFLSILQDTGSLGGSEMDQFFGKFGTGGKIMLEALRGIVDLFNLVRQNLDVVAALAGAFIAYKVALSVSNAAMAIYNGLMKVMTIVTEAQAAEQSVLNALFLANPVVIIALGVAALAATLFILYKRSKTVHDAIDNLGHVLKDVLGQAFAFLQEVVPPVVDVIVKGLGKVADFMGTVLPPVIDFVKAHWIIFLAAFSPLAAIVVLVVKHFDQIKQALGFLAGQVSDFVGFWGDVWKQWGDDIMFVVGAVTTIIRFQIGVWLAIFRTAFAVIKAVVQAGLAVVQAVWERVGGTIMKVVRIAFDTIVGVIRGELQIIKGIVNVVLGILTGDWSRAWNGLKGIVSGALNAVKSLLSGFVSTIRTVAGRIGGALKDGIVGGIKGLASAIAGLVTGAINSAVIDPLNSLEIPSVSIAGHDFGGGHPFHIDRLQRGTGFFPGGLALTGEKGPEISGLPRGAVASNDALVKTMADALKVAFGGVPPGGITIIQQPGESGAALARRVLDEAAARVR